MGALTLGILLPTNPADRAHARATSAHLPWLAPVRQGASDLCEAAQTLGLSCEVVAVPGDANLPEPELRPLTQLMRRRLADVDRVLVVAHGQLGGSGRIHATARACGLPVLGPDELAISRAQDKLWARRQLSRRNLPVPRTLALHEGIDPGLAHTELARLGWPCVIKPRHGGAEAGARRLTSPAMIRDAIAEATQSGDRELLMEREVLGRELSVIVVEGEVLGVAEIERSTGPRGRRTELLTCPADLTRCQRAGIENLARRACAALQLRGGPTRVDLILSERDNEVVLDVEPLPRLHRDGVVARVARAAGLSYPRLCAQLLAGPLAPSSRDL